jgi:hypothetical protein
MRRRWISLPLLGTTLFQKFRHDIGISRGHRTKKWVNWMTVSRFNSRGTILHLGYLLRSWGSWLLPVVIRNICHISYLLEESIQIPQQYIFQIFWKAILTDNAQVRSAEREAGSDWSEENSFRSRRTS